MTAPSWQAWAPPLSPPEDEGAGLSHAIAEQIAEQWWQVDPYQAAGLMWEAYANTLPSSPTVSSVNTGAQTVTYDPPVALGPYGDATRQAAWYLARASNGLESVPLGRAYGRRTVLPDMEWWIDP